MTNKPSDVIHLLRDNGRTACGQKFRSIGQNNTRDPKAVTCRQCKRSRYFENYETEHKPPGKAELVHIIPGSIIEFEYTKHDGGEQKRRMDVSQFSFGVTPFDPDPQWFITGACHTKLAVRTFAVRRMRNVEVITIRGTQWPPMN